MKVTNDSRWELNQEAGFPNADSLEYSTYPGNAQQIASHAVDIESKATCMGCVKVYRDKINKQMHSLRGRAEHAVQQDEKTNCQNMHAGENKNIDVVTMKSFIFKSTGLVMIM